MGHVTNLIGKIEQDAHNVTHHTIHLKNIEQHLVKVVTSLGKFYIENFSRLFKSESLFFFWVSK